MVRTRLPQCFVALHTFETDQDILHGIVQGMAHMQLAGNVRRRHHDGEWFLIRIDFGMEIAAVYPFLIQTLFDALRIVGLCKFFAHGNSPFCFLVSVKQYAKA